MTQFKIEKGIPVPPPEKPKPHPAAELLKQLEVGDSVVVDNWSPNYGKFARILGISITSRRLSPEPCTSCIVDVYVPSTGERYQRQKCYNRDCPAHRNRRVWRVA